MNRILINAKTKEKRIAVLSDQKLIEYHFFRTSEQAEVGEIYLAQIEKIDKKIAAAFLNIGREKAFIHLKDIPDHIITTQGSYLAIQIVREGSKTKLPLASAMIEFSSALMVLIIGKHYISVSKRISDLNREKLIAHIQPHLKEKEAVILRSAAEHATDSQRLTSLQELRLQQERLYKIVASSKKTGLLISSNDKFKQLLDQLQARYPQAEIITDTKMDFLNQLAFHKKSSTLFTDYYIESQIQKLNNPEVKLTNGSTLVIEKTEAMWVIDVNSSHFVTQTNKTETVNQINLQAIPEIIRQIRLRNMSGFIVIDFISGMSESGSIKLVSQMEEQLKLEAVTTQLVGFSKSGLMQLTRRKRKKSLLEETSVTCPICEGSGHVQSALSLAYALERELITYKQSVVKIITTEAVLAHFLDLHVDVDISIEWEIAEEEKPFYIINAALPD